MEPVRDLLSPRWTVGRHLDAVRWRFSDGPTSDQTEEILTLLGLPGLLTRYPHELSGGERRRAELAIAWSRLPRCLLADEPFAGIQPGDAELIGRALKRLARAGCAVVVTGHEVPQLLGIADDVIWMTAGTTHGLGSVAEARAHEQFRREYLGPGRQR